MAILETIRRFADFPDVAKFERHVERALASIVVWGYTESATDMVASPFSIVVGQGTITVTLPPGTPGDRIVVVRDTGTTTVDGVALDGTTGNVMRDFLRTSNGWMIVGAN